MDSFPPGYEVSPSTWLYLSLVLVVAAYFRFARLWSLRNFDLLLLLAASPGVYLVERTSHTAFGYSWLFVVTGAILVRLLLDSTLRKRPYIGQNLNAEGSAFLCVAAFALIAMEAAQHNSSHLTLQTIAQAEQLVEGPAGAAVAAESSSGPIAPILFAPFGVMFDMEEQAARAIAVAAHLFVIVGLIFVGRNLFNDLQLGIAMATLYLLLPCTAYGVGQVSHVLPAALTVWALVAYRRPMVSGVLLGLACGVMFFPVFLLPLWTAFYGRKKALRFCTALLLVAALVVSVAAMTSPGPDSFLRKTIGTIHLLEMLSFRQPDGVIGFWTPELISYRIPVIVTFFILLAALTAFPRHKQVEHLTASSTAIIVATQFWYPVQGGVYLLWYLPLLLVVVFRPRLAHLQGTTPAEGELAATKVPALAGPHAPRTFAARDSLRRN